jgi:LTXXQ motif family protein
MKRIVFYTVAAASLSISFVALTTTNAAGNQLAEAIPTARIQHWVASYEALVGAKVGCLKAVLQLAPEQNELWEDFEKAVRHAAKTRRMDDVRQMLGNHERISFAERMDSTAGRTARRGGELEEISEASKPLYSRLDNPQKRKFNLLSRELVMTVTGSIGGKRGVDDEGAWLPENWEEQCTLTGAGT